MSRLTAAPEGATLKVGHLAAHNFRRMEDGDYLLTSDSGHYVVITEAQFKAALAGREDETTRRRLEEAGFLRERLDFRELAKSYVRKNSFHWFPGPSLHMIVVTVRCNQKCLYCHSSVVDPSRTDTDMDLETAKRTVDFIFKTPNPSLCIEFQGGEPLLNWPVVKFIIRYAQAKAKAEKRRLIMALVCNFTLMTDDKLQFLLDHHVSICTSLDGPPELHNKNRPFLGGGEAQQKVVGWLEKIQKLVREDGRNHYLPGALMTTTRFSLGYAREIVDLYVRLGMEHVFIRPLSPIGYAKRVWSEIGYGASDFVRFYEEALDYIIELNHAGKAQLMERMALVLLTKILKGQDPGFMDLRAPAGAVLGCLAYNYDGGIFVSDEGRMVDHQGDPVFKVGDVAASSWADVVDHPTTRACVTASTLENQPMCQQCAYKPWCGVEPVFHYEAQRSVWGQTPVSGWCVGHMGQFDVLFKKLKDPKAMAVFRKWMERDECKWQEGTEVAAA